MKIKSSHTDDRGDIHDIFVNSPKDHCSVITCNKGAVRGNHFHKSSTQFTFILSGKFKIFKANVDENGNLISKVSVDIIEENELIKHPPFEAHTFEAISDNCKILAFACGKRGGKYYEEDTFRLSEKLNSL